ncbi:MAG: calcium-binding protein [Octadecabacter sp.]|nr:calcium-binding protein [Octadecabacter sp.]
MKTSLLVASIAAGLTLAGAAAARDAQPPRMDMPAFEEIDLNGDGGVTAEEMQQAREAMRAARFAQADANGDGALSVEELIAAAQNDRAERMADRIARMVERFDDNGDGVLQPEEMGRDGARRGGERMFDRADANDDGSLSAEEYSAAQAHMAERGGRDGHGEGRRHN